jgi:hypothetical protein
MSNNITICQKFEFSLTRGTTIYKMILRITGDEQLDRSEVRGEVTWLLEGGVPGNDVDVVLETLALKVLKDTIRIISYLFTKGCEYLVWIELWDSEDGIVTPIKRIKIS